MGLEERSAVRSVHEAEGLWGCRGIGVVGKWGAVRSRMGGRRRGAGGVSRGWTTRGPVELSAGTAVFHVVFQKPC